MASRIFYYSRSGNCARLAQTFAQNGENHMVQIIDLPEGRYLGALGYFKAVISTIFKSESSFRIVGDKFADVSENILITPVWGSRIPPTFKSFLLKERFDSDIKVTVVTVSNSGNGTGVFHQIMQILHDYGVHTIKHCNVKTEDIV